MAALPYITAPGNIEKALTGIKNAAVPQKVTQDFVKTILQIPGGSGDQMTAFLKKIGFASTTGEPTDLYRRFRNPTSSGEAVANAIRTAYAPLYTRNEFMHRLPDNQLQGLIVEETGQAADSNAVKNITSAIKHLKAHANFDAPAVEANPVRLPLPAPEASRSEGDPPRQEQRNHRGMGLNLGYTINLNLPATANPEVFDAIFRSLKQHLLSDDDA